MASSNPFELFRSGDLEGAEHSAVQALAATPSDPRLHHLHGVLLCRRGAIVEGVSALKKALTLAPGSAEIRMVLVRALIDSGQGQEALSLALRPAPGPAAAELWRVRAEAAEAAGLFSERIEALRHCALAITSARIQDSPHDLGLLTEKARLLAILKRDFEAVALYRSILARQPDRLEAVRELGLLLERGNRLDELTELVDQSLTAGVDPSRIAYLLALCAWRERRLKDAHSHLEDASRGAGADPVRIAQLSVKVEDALGNFQDAFAAATTMNGAINDRGRWLGEAATHRSRMRDVAATLTPEWFASWRPEGPGGRNPPIFLLGFPRSGTTLLDTFLMGHPGLHVIEEAPLMDAVALQLRSFEDIAHLGQQETERLRGIYFKQMTARLPETWTGKVVDKMPLNLLCAPLIHRLFPDAKVVFAQRHPCDCVLSAYMHNFDLNPSTACFLELEGAADLYDVAMGIWTKTIEGLPVDHYNLVYEELVVDPEKELRKLFDFLRIEWHEDVLDHQSTARSRGSISTASYDQVTEKIDRRPSGRWLRYRDAMTAITPTLLPWADRLGYERTDV